MHLNISPWRNSHDSIVRKTEEWRREAAASMKHSAEKSLWK